MAEIIRITDGNAFKLRITGEILLENYREAADMSVVSKLVVNFVRRGRLPQTASVDEQGRIVALNDGSLALGVYGVELTGYYNGEPWRYFSQDVFEIVDENSEANESTGDDVPMYDVTFVVSFGGDSITAAFVEAAISTHNNDEDSHPGITEELSKKVDDIMVDDESVVDVDPETGRRTVNLHKDQLGKVDDVLVNGESVLNEDNEAEFTIPEKVSDLPNDADYATQSELTTGLAAKQDTITAVAEPTIADDGGNPSASVEFEGGELAFAFRNLKLRFSDLTAADKAELKGDKGDQGDSAVYDPSSPDAPDFVMANTTGQSTTKAMTQKAVTDMHTDFMYGIDKTTYEASGEIDYYTPYGYGYNNYGVVQFTNTTAVSFNKVKIGPIKADSGTPTATYYIKHGLVDNVLTPANLSTIKTGTIKLSTTFTQYEIDLDDVFTADSERIFVYVICTTKIRFLGVGGEDSPSPHERSNRSYYSSNGSNVNVTWLTPSGNRYACQPILRLVLEPQVNAIIDGRINAATPAIVAQASARAEEVGEELQGFVSDTDNTYKYEGEIEHYQQYGKGYRNASIAQATKSRSESIKITSVVCGPIKTESSGSVDYRIVLTTYNNANNYSAGTLLKQGTKTTSTSYTSFEVKLDGEVTVPAGSIIVVYYMTGPGSYRYILGKANDSGVPTMADSQLVLYGGSASNAWTRGNTGYVAVQPILKYHKDGGCKTMIEQEIENAIPGLIDEMGKAIGDKVDELLPTIESDVETAIDSVGVYLPDTITAVVGDTLELFWRSIVKAVNPYVYDISVVCTKGSCFSKKFYYAPQAADVGSTMLTVNVKNRNGNLVGTASTTLVTVSAPTSPASQLNVFCFGDSLTAGGQWPCEAKRRLVSNITVDNIAGSNLSNISLCGRMEKTLDYGSSKSSTANFYGRGGWTWATFCAASTAAYRVTVSGVTSVAVGATYTNNSKTFTVEEVNITDGSGTLLLSGSGAPTSSGTLTKASGIGDAEITFSAYETENENPLWDTSENKFTFVPYVETYGGGSMDVVYVMLSWNGQSAWKNYSADDATGHIASAKTFIRKIHSEYPNADVKVLGIQMPSANDGLGQNYGTDQSYSQRYGLYVCAWNYNKALQDLCNQSEFSDYCEYVDVATQFDSEYNFPGGNSKANKRATTTYYAHTNGVHPSNPGYYQIADVVWRNFVKEYCQED